MTSSRPPIVGAADWPEVSVLFDEAAELPPPGRQAWLDSLPLPARRHRDTLARMLDDLDRVRQLDFLQVRPDADAAAVGRIVGAYRLVREIGRGGMSSVWLAERTDGSLKRSVALKLPHPGLATQVFRDRLLRERDILAALTHAHIARLYDAGVTPEGQPYIALAFVDGETLTAHAEAAGLGVRARVALFTQVLEAVQYAHSRLVVHRDLKPSNILVDREAQVQLLDFGIAKLLVDGQAEPTALTVDSGAAMTPDYAAPEQLAGANASTASDIYSLGVVLYELLAGERPYRLRRDPLAPLSTAVDAVHWRPPSAAARDPARARALRGDLDTIVMKALAHDPDQRYASADAFAQDLRRHLEGQPVLARPATLAYRGARFVARYSYAVGAVALLVLSLAAGLAGTLWQAREARAQAQRALAVKDFLVGLFKQADPNKTAVGELTALQMLERGQEDLRSKLADQPRLRAELSGVLSEVYSQLNDETHALPLARTRSELALSLDGPRSLPYGEALEAQAEVESALGDHAASLAHYEQAREVFAHHPRERAADIAETGGHIAFQQLELGHTQDAVATLNASVPLLASALGAAHHNTLHYKTILAALYARQGDFERATRLADEVLPLLPVLDRERPTNAATIRANLAQMLMTASRFAQAESLFREALAESRRLWGEDSQNTLVDVRSLGQAQFEAGEFADAARSAEEAATHAASALGPASDTTKTADSMAVRPLIMVGRVGPAEDLARRSLPAAPLAVEAMTPNQRDVENRLALALLFNDKADEAREHLERLVGARPRSPNAAVDARSWLYLAGVHHAAGRLQEAAQAAARAQPLIEGSPANRDVQLARLKLTQALIVADARDAPAAERLVAEAEGHIGRVLGPQHPLHAVARAVRAEALRVAGQVDEARRMATQARQELLQSSGAVLPEKLPLVY